MAYKLIYDVRPLAERLYEVKIYQREAAERLKSLRWLEPCRHDERIFWMRLPAKSQDSVSNAKAYFTCLIINMGREN